jgi:hypothetical protein
VVHRLRMSGELGDWLAEICSSEPVTAREVGAALAALMGEAGPADLAFVTDLAAQPGHADDPADPCEAADSDYQALLESLQLLRHQAADAGNFRQTTRVRITPAGSQPWPFTDAEIAAAEERERKLAAQARSCQSAIDQFRAAKEAAKARYSAAAASRDVQLALLESASWPDPPADQPPRADPTTADESTADEARADDARADDARADRARAEADLAHAEAGVAASTTAFADLRALAARLRALVAGPGGAERAGDITEGLLELRADPLVTDVRVLLAAEPPGTVTLLAVLHGEAAIHEHRDQAIRLAGELLTELRAGSNPQAETDGPVLDRPVLDRPVLDRPVPASAGAGDAATAAGELSFADAAAFLEQFFPGSADLIARHAADLATAATLRGLRHRAGLSLAELATRTGMTELELWRLESGGFATASLADVALYVRGLGCGLTVQTAGDARTVIVA